MLPFYKKTLLQEKKEKTSRLTLSGSLSQLDTSIILGAFSNLVEEGPGELLKVRRLCKYFNSFIKKYGKDLLLRKLDFFSQKQRPTFFKTINIPLYCRFIIVIKGQYHADIMSVPFEKNNSSRNFNLPFFELIKALDFFLRLYRKEENVKTQEAWLSYILALLSVIKEKDKEFDTREELSSYLRDVLTYLKEKISCEDTFEVKHRLALVNLFRLEKFFPPISAEAYEFLVQWQAKETYSSCQKLIGAFVSHEKDLRDVLRGKSTESLLNEEESFKTLNEALQKETVFAEYIKILQSIIGLLDKDNTTYLTRRVFAALIDNYSGIRLPQAEHLLVGVQVLKAILRKKHLAIFHLNDASIGRIVEYTRKVLFGFAFIKEANPIMAVSLVRTFFQLRDQLTSFVFYIAPHYVEEALSILLACYEKTLGKDNCKSPYSGLVFSLGHFRFNTASSMLFLANEISFRVHNRPLIKAVFEAVNEEIKQISYTGSSGEENECNTNVFSDEKDKWLSRLQTLKDKYGFLNTHK